jgi:hypothetical protein
MPKHERAELVAHIKASLDMDQDLQTTYYPPERPLLALPPGTPVYEPMYWFARGDTIDWVIEHYGELSHPAILNFASAKKRGGGFATGHGVLAQEECLCMSTDLYVSLKHPAAAGYYALNTRAPRDGLYHSTIIYTGAAHILRTGSLSDPPFAPLPEPLGVSIITCPAVNYGLYRERPGADLALAQREMQDRLARVFQVALLNGHRSLVLGPWGCGVFRGNIKDLMTNIKLCPYTKYFQDLYFLSPRESTVLEMQYSL